MAFDALFGYYPVLASLFWLLDETIRQPQRKRLHFSQSLSEQIFEEAIWHTRCVSLLPISCHVPSSQLLPLPGPAPPVSFLSTYAHWGPACFCSPFVSMWARVMARPAGVWQKGEEGREEEDVTVIPQFRNWAAVSRSPDLVPYGKTLSSGVLSSRLGSWFPTYSRSNLWGEGNSTCRNLNFFICKPRAKL